MRQELEHSEFERFIIARDEANLEDKLETECHEEEQELEQDAPVLSCEIAKVSRLLQCLVKHDERQDV